MKVYLDDIRDAPEGWVRTYTAQETINLLLTEKVEELSLDHDLSFLHYSGIYSSEDTGYHVLLWLENQVYFHGNSRYVPNKIHIHTANPTAKEKMERCLKSIMKKIKE